MIVLAIDSSATTLSVALLRDAEPLAERGWRARRPHGEALIPAIEATLRDAQLTLDEIGMIAVATGPGSFNGIRGGIAVATGLALARDLPTVGVPTLDALAYAQAGRAEVVCALLPAGRGELYGASFAGNWQHWRRRDDYTVAPLDQHLRELPAGTLLCGELPAGTAEHAAARGLTCVPAVASFARASFAGALAAARAAEAGFDAAASLHALYLRRPGITRPARSSGLVGGAL
jgi:tRNA threonylcarbamoyladenosine biosynthesis protein TsaB